MAFISAKIDSNASGIISLSDDLINYVLYLALCVDLLLRINSSSGSIDLFLLLFLLIVCVPVSVIMVTQKLIYLPTLNLNTLQYVKIAQTILTICIALSRSSLAFKIFSYYRNTNYQSNTVGFETS